MELFIVELVFCDAQVDKDRRCLLRRAHEAQRKQVIFGYLVHGMTLAHTSSEKFIARMRTSRIALAVKQLTGVFVHDPERELSLAEAERLTGLDASSCQIVLETLQDARFLTRAGNGRFIRTDRPQPTEPEPPSA